VTTSSRFNYLDQGIGINYVHFAGLHSRLELIGPHLVGRDRNFIQSNIDRANNRSGRQRR